MKKISKIKRIGTLGLVFLMSINSFAAIVSDNDGTAFVTKAEFDTLKKIFNKQIDDYNNSIDGKIDGAIASYLSGIKLVNTQVIKFGLTDLVNKAPMKHLSKEEAYKWRRPSTPNVIYDALSIISCFVDGAYYPDWSWGLNATDTRPTQAAIKIFHCFGTANGSGGMLFGDSAGNISTIANNPCINMTNTTYERTSFGAGHAIPLIVQNLFGEQDPGFIYPMGDDTWDNYSRNYPYANADTWNTTYIKAALKYYFGKNEAGGTVTKDKTDDTFNCRKKANNQACKMPFKEGSELPARYTPMWGNLYNMADSNAEPCYFYTLGNDDNLIIYDEARSKLKIWEPEYLTTTEYSIPTLATAKMDTLLIKANINPGTTNPAEWAAFICPIINYKEFKNGSNRFKFNEVNVEEYANCLKNDGSKKCSFSDGAPLFIPEKNGSLRFQIKLTHYDATMSSSKFKVYVLDEPYNNTDKLTKAVPIKVNGLSSNIVNPDTTTDIFVEKIEKGKSYYLVWMIDGKTYGGQLSSLSDGTMTFED